MKSKLILALALVAGGVAGPSAMAQAIHPYDRPVTSPYLMLLDRTGGDFAGTYFRRVLPELEWRQRTLDLRRGVGRLETDLRETRRLMQSPTSGLSPTGHAAGFGPNRRYFPGR